MKGIRQSQITTLHRLKLSSSRILATLINMYSKRKVNTQFARYEICPFQPNTSAVSATDTTEHFLPILLVTLKQEIMAVSRTQSDSSSSIGDNVDSYYPARR